MLAETSWAAAAWSSGIIVITIVAGIASVLIAVIVARAWRQERLDSHEAHLTEQMIQRGMSAEEIERVLRAGFKREYEQAG